MGCWSALTTTTGGAAAEALGAAMEAMDPAPTGVGVFEMEDGSGLWEVGGYFDAPPDRSQLALLAAAHGARDFAISELPETGWVARVERELAPVRAGRFFLYGSHDSGRVPGGVEPLLIEAAMAFGTGHHGTTVGCLEAMEALAAHGPAPARVLDVGCGTGVLAMAAARIWPGAAILASDNDAVAIEVAEVNLAANELSGRIALVCAEGLDAPEIAAAAPFDLILANILKEPLLALAAPIAGAAAPGGRVIISGLLEEQADEVAARFAECGLNVSETRTIQGWSTLCLEKSGG
mgnify:CR=1 FL=1